MSRNLIMTVLVAGAVTCAGCTSTPTALAPGTESDAADLAAITAVRDSFIKAYNSGDAAAFEKLYAENAVSMANHQPSISGRAAIVANQKTTFDQFTAHIEITPDETRVTGTVAYDRGRYKMTMMPRTGGPAMSDEGRYIVLLEKTEAGWVVTRDIDNSTMPMPEPQAAAKGKS